MEEITDADYRHAKYIYIYIYIYIYMYKEFEMNNLGDYHNLYVQSDTL